MMMLFSPGPNRAVRRARQSRSARLRAGVRAAVARALTGAQLYLQGDMTLEQVAISVGSNVHYIAAAIWLVRAGDMPLIKDVVDGHIPLLKAAEWVKPQVKVIEALKAADPAAKAAIYTATGFTNELSKLLTDSTSAVRTAAAELVGVDAVWDDMVAPLVSTTAE